MSLNPSAGSSPRASRHRRSRIRGLRAWVLRALKLFSRERADTAAELESHLAMHIEDNIRAGMTSAQARRHALVKLGGLLQVEEQCREQRGIPIVEHLVQDVRFGARMLRKTPTFTIVVVLTLGLGIGANAAIFSVVNAVLLRPLPFHDPDHLMWIWATNERSGVRDDVASYPDFEDWRAQAASFESMAAFTWRDVGVSAGDHTELVPALQVTPGFFETLGVQAALGRVFGSGETEDAASHVVVLSDRMWKARFGGRGDVLGQTIRSNEASYTIVGVMPTHFAFSADHPEQLYTPLVRDPSRNHGFLRVLGRLREGTRMSTAQAELDVITRAIAQRFPKSNKDVGARVVPLVSALVGSARTGLFVLVVVVAPRNLSQRHAAHTAVAMAVGGGSHLARTLDPGAHCDTCCRGGRSRCSDQRHENARRGARRISSAAASLYTAARRVRRAGARTRGGRPLRRDGIHRDAADSGNRDSTGAGRRPTCGSGSRTQTGRVPRGRGRRRRACGHCPCGRRAYQSDTRRATQRSRNVGVRFDTSVDRRAAGELPAGAARIQSRSDSCVEAGIVG
jgi:hypothetical protein